MGPCRNSLRAPGHHAASALNVIPKGPSLAPAEPMMGKVDCRGAIMNPNMVNW